MDAWVKERSRVLVMGVLNVTPDSFYDGGRYCNVASAVEHALLMDEEGADIVDVGGASSRPGSKGIGIDEELERVMPVMEGIRCRSDVLLSIDTTSAPVAKEALSCGATMVNDISALRFDPHMPEVIAEGGAFVVLMHMLGTPEDMQLNPVYTDVVQEIRVFLAQRIDAAEREGISKERIIIDPGIGFGKTLSHNLAIIRDMSSFVDLGVPLLIGVSRKSFLGKILDLPTEDRLEGTIAANAVAVFNGADILRVHDVKEGRRTANVASRLRNHAA